MCFLWKIYTSWSIYLLWLLLVKFFMDLSLLINGRVSIFPALLSAMKIREYFLFLYFGNWDAPPIFPLSISSLAFYEILCRIWLAANF